jgi:hypothetical protein
MLTGILAVPALLAGVLTGAAPATAAGSADPKPLPHATVEKLLRAPGPKTVVMDVKTGEVLSVKQTTADDEDQLGISNDNICYTGYGCYYSGQIPYADQGFFGTPGTYYGNWPYRYKWRSGYYTVSMCWVGACSKYKFAPNTTGLLNGQVTGTSWTIY